MSCAQPLYRIDKDSFGRTKAKAAIAVSQLRGKLNARHGESFNHR